MKTKKENYEICKTAGFPVSKSMSAQELSFCANIAKNKTRRWLKPVVKTESVTPAETGTRQKTGFRKSK